MENSDAWIVYSKFIIDKKKKEGNFDYTINIAKEKYNLNIYLVAAQDFSIVCDNGINKIYYKDKLIKKVPKIIIFRKYDIYLARQFELLGVKVLNSSQSMVDARNKMKTYQILTQNGINIPKTLYIGSGVKRKYFSYDQVCKYFNSEKIIIKYVFGARGKDVHLIDNEKDFNSVTKKYDGICIFQEYIENSFGKDIRCYVIGGKFVGAAIRQSNGKDFRSNLAQGGHIVKFDFNEKVASLAEASAKCLKLDICGVDILYRSDDDYTICEVNSLPGFKSLNSTNVSGNLLLLELIKNNLEI